ncbi:F0F1 ATP synthase subunit epsilon [Actinomycetospora sp. TBRC 11914]|uniref:F0F1 ATP synthase subunit epsilon n=1 Tax=Actinomycetospora sp. TBRC 11914 TaxID=2729387 RepID=UPI00145EE1CC|nr:F0F1 ATP synthase subunit epsilon [Actinomycetospora sp. TBRC 11914]NMO91277.1 F0F1 ATP synthase subunit epsilon [Actinomycetospora sp. TBRC 11914]
MAEMQVDLVAVERQVWSGTAEFVFARTSVGEIGILPRHEPLIAQLTEAGMVRIDPTDGESVRAAVFGGFLSMDGEKLTILAEEAELGDEIDVSAAQQARDSANEDDAEGRAAKARAEARLAAAGQGSE